MSSAEQGGKTAARPALGPVVWTLVLTAGAAGWLAAALAGPGDRAWQALLVSFVFYTPLAAGALVWSAILTLTGAVWAGRSERWALAGVAFAPVSIVALAALGLAHGHWAPWASADHLPQGLWLSPGFLFGRDLGALVVFWVVAAVYVRRRMQGRGRGAAAGLALTYAAVFSLLGFDLVKALDPHWVSSLFGGYFFVTGLYGAAAGWTLLSIGAGAPADRRHDLGKLVLALSLLSTYMMFSQLLPIWYGNLPWETRFVIARWESPGWGAVSLGLVAWIYLGPLVLLLTRQAKRSAGFLGAATLAILAGLWVERWWLVMPTLGRPCALGLAEVSAAAGLLGALGLAVWAFGRGTARMEGLVWER